MTKFTVVVLTHSCYIGMIEYRQVPLKAHQFFYSETRSHIVLIMIIGQPMEFDHTLSSLMCKVWPSSRSIADHD